jgi:hypothetical protein
MIKYNIGILLILVILMPACTSVTEKDLHGTYIAKYSFGTEKLLLNAGGEYIQEVSIKGDPKGKPKILTQRGHWRYEPADKYIELKNALDVADPTDGLKKDYDVPFDGICLRKVRRVFPNIRLGSAYENVDFVKMK